MQAYIDTTEAEAIMPTVDEQTQQRQRIAAVVPVQQTATPELEISNERLLVENRRFFSNAGQLTQNFR